MIIPYFFSFSKLAYQIFTFFVFKVELMKEFIYVALSILLQLFHIYICRPFLLYEDCTLRVERNFEKTGEYYGILSIEVVWCSDAKPLSDLHHVVCEITANLWSKPSLSGSMSVPVYKLQILMYRGHTWPWTFAGHSSDLSSLMEGIWPFLMLLYNVLLITIDSCPI